MTGHTHTSQFLTEVVARNPHHAAFLDRSVKEMEPETRDEIESYLAYCRDIGLEASEVADCYNTTVLDILREQAYFLRHRRYRYDRFDQVAAHVYFDSNYMTKYMHGLALTAFLWPNHRAMHRFFNEHIPGALAGDYLEIGPGHGYYFKQVAQRFDFDNLVGVDISETSIGLTRSILEHHGVMQRQGDRIRLLAMDFLTSDLGGVRPSFIVMGEVLEHVEQPRLFIDRLRALSGEDTKVYLTTCVNAPAIDHIYHFRSVAEVEDMLQDARFCIAERLHVPHLGKTLAECTAHQLPVNVAYFLDPA